MTHPLLPLLAGLFALGATIAPARAIDIGIDLGGIGVGVGVGDGVDIGVGVGDAEIGLSLGAGALPADAVTLDHEGALRAVREEKALPLDQILKAAKGLVEGEVIDAQLILVRGFLLYELRVLGSGGQLADAYFYAQSGRPVVPR